MATFRIEEWDPSVGREGADGIREIEDTKKKGEIERAKAQPKSEYQEERCVNLGQGQSPFFTVRQEERRK